jgi:hypothetical protein
VQLTSAGKLNVKTRLVWLYFPKARPIPEVKLADGFEKLLRPLPVRKSKMPLNASASSLSLASWNVKTAAPWEEILNVSPVLLLRIRQGLDYYQGIAINTWKPNNCIARALQAPLSPRPFGGRYHFVFLASRGEILCNRNFHSPE